MQLSHTEWEITGLGCTEWDLAAEAYPEGFGEL